MKSEPQPEPATSATEIDLDFPAVGVETWRRRVEAELGGESFASLVARDRDGLEVGPLYTEGDLPAGLRPQPRPEEPGWRIAQEYAQSSAADAAEAIRADRERGLDVAWLRLDEAFRAGAPAAEGHAGIAVAGAGDFGKLLAAAGVPGAAVVLEIGAGAAAARDLLAGWARRREVSPDELRGVVGCDPLATLAAAGRLPDDAWQQLAELVRWAGDEAPSLRTVLVSTRPYHDAGATPVQELALLAATAVEVLRRLAAGGIGPAAAASKVMFSMSAGSEVFGEIAKLRAARVLWAKIAAACGASAPAMRLHVRTSSPSAVARAPRLNLLRASAQTFAAVVGGADLVTTAPFDEIAAEPGETGRRLAINTQLILAEEAHLARVADPAGGSFALEALTDGLARAAWTLFRDLEARGGMERCLRDGRVSGLVRSAAEAKLAAVGEGRDVLVGGNRFVDPSREPLAVAATPAAPAAALPLPTLRWSQDVEARPEEAS